MYARESAVALRTEDCNSLDADEKPLSLRLNRPSAHWPPTFSVLRVGGSRPLASSVVPPWVCSAVALLVAAAVGRYVWKQTANLV